MKSIFYIRLLYLFLIFVIFCIPIHDVYAVNCPAGSNDAATHFDLSGLTCTLANTDDGPADGDVILNASTSLTLLEGQALIFPSGRKITIGGGTINISKTGLGAKIIKGVLCLTDADNDYYPASNAISARTRGPCTDTKKSIADIKAQNSTVTADCNDLSYSAINTCCAAGDTPSTVGSELYGMTCKKCVSNSLADQTNTEDLFTQCTASYNACSGACVKTGPDGNCNGAGGCNTGGGSAYVADQKVCSGGSEIAASASVYASIADSCSAGACSGTRYYRACNGAGATRSDNVGAASATIYATSGNTFTAACASSTASPCTTRTACKNYAYCNGSGACNTPTNIDSVSDTYSDCAGLSCSSYYFGWSSNVCYYRLDISAANHVCNGSGACKTAADQCPSSTQGSSTGVTRTACKTMVGCTGTTAGSLGNVAATIDTYNDCPAPSAGSYACRTGNCNGAGACAVIDATFDNGICAACTMCDGTNSTCVNNTNNTQDNAGTYVCNATCKKCSAGSCINQTSSEDLFNQCAAANTSFVLANNGSGNTCTTMCSWYMCNLGNCSGSGACTANTNCICTSVGTDAAGTNTYAMAQDCVQYSGKTCALLLDNISYPVCSGRQSKWTNCKCIK